MCALIIMTLFLVVHWRYKIESFSVFIFPLIFVMDAGRHYGTASRGVVQPRDPQSLAHHAYRPGDAGICGLLLTAVASVFYCIQEQELKRKSPRQFYYRLPPLGTLDELISRFMGGWIRLHHAGHHRGKHLGVYRAGHELDFRPQNQHLVPHMGHLSGDGVHAGHGRMARKKGRHFGDHGPGLLRHYVGGA
jgi:hypothetical protein